MFNHNVPQELLNAFRIPIQYKILTWGVTMSIIACGAITSIKYSDWTWLARFGSFIVIVSLALEASGFVQKFIDKIIGITSEIMPEIVQIQVERQPHLYGLSGNETTEQIEQISNKELKRRLESVTLLIEKKITSDLRKMEFSVATIGTLSWGFADLINKL